MPLLYQRIKQKLIKINNIDAVLIKIYILGCNNKKRNAILKRKQKTEEIKKRIER